MQDKTHIFDREFQIFVGGFSLERIRHISYGMDEQVTSPLPLKLENALLNKFKFEII